MKTPKIESIVKKEIKQEVKIICSYCHKDFLIVVDEDLIGEGTDGTFIRDFVPHMDVDNKEFIISQTCGTCLDEILDMDNLEEETTESEV